MFDEIILNAIDNRKKIEGPKVVIDVDRNLITVISNGDYDDQKKKATGGWNGYGAKLASIFSTEFKIETTDGKSKYRQV